jgi:hypothetical protein
MHDILTDDNFILYCAQHYDGRYCSSTQDFFDDLNRLKYIKKLITRYIQNGDLKERLILNHIIVLNNVFGATVTCKILYFKLRDEFKYIKPFLILLNILPEFIYNVNGENAIDTNLISMDQTIIEVLRKI